VHNVGRGGFGGLLLRLWLRRGHRAFPRRHRASFALFDFSSGLILAAIALSLVAALLMQTL